MKKFNDLKKRFKKKLKNKINNKDYLFLISSIKPDLRA